MIFLVRDGRDVVDSWLDAHRADSWALREGAFPVSAEGREALVRWQSAVWAYRMEVAQRAYEEHRDDRKLLVRYEHLRADPGRELGGICRSMAVKVERERLDEIADRHSYERLPTEDKGRDKEIRTARPGGWREHLSDSEHRIMHEVMGPKLAQLGYLPRFAARAA